jgi:hypothetical protein
MSSANPTKREVELEQALEEVIDILEHKKATHKKHCYAWRAKNIEKVRAYAREKQREYYARNKEKILERRRELHAKKSVLNVVEEEPNQEST